MNPFKGGPIDRNMADGGGHQIKILATIMQLLRNENTKFKKTV